ncbi:SAF domain-containing protein [Luteococcus peritonei]|uniref:SAF domain-containing protein n=1 Tax=Luteococcus peritonei TaxID=88874 RepID=A0ABW4RXY1_9ACTN
MRSSTQPRPTHATRRAASAVRPAGGRLAALTRAVRWHRRGLAAVCAFCAVLLALTSLAPASAATTTVLVAADDLPAGRRLIAADLRPADFPPDLVPHGARSAPEQLVGRVLAAPTSRGSVLTERSTVSVQLTPQPGEVLVPVPVADPSVLALLQVGDKVSVVAPGDGGQAVTLASRVRVAALPAPEDDGVTGSGSRALVLLSTDRATGARLAAAGTGQPLGIALG